MKSIYMHRLYIWDKKHISKIRKDTQDIHNSISYQWVKEVPMGIRENYPIFRALSRLYSVIVLRDKNNVDMGFFVLGRERNIEMFLSTYNRIHRNIEREVKIRSRDWKKRIKWETKSKFKNTIRKKCQDTYERALREAIVKVKLYTTPNYVRKLCKELREQNSLFKLLTPVIW